MSSVRRYFSIQAAWGYYMNPGTQALLTQQLKILKMSTMLKSLDAQIRRAKQEHLDYAEFLLNLAEAEVQVRLENGRKRRLQEARFPIKKPLELFDFNESPGLDIRLRRDALTTNGPRPTRENMLMVHFVPSSCLRAALECFEFAREGVLQPVPRAVTRAA